MIPTAIPLMGVKRIPGCQTKQKRISSTTLSPKLPLQKSVRIISFKNSPGGRLGPLHVPDRDP